MKKLFPVLIALIGLAGGVVGGTMFKPAAEASEHASDSEHAESSGHGEAKAKSKDSHGGDHDSHGSDDEYIYVGLEKPFFAPIARNSGSNAIVRIDIHLEVPASMEEAAHKHDPKLRDAFLRAVLEFSENGGFARVRIGEGFDVLRDDLLVGARRVLGPDVKSVLIGEILTRDG